MALTDLTRLSTSGIATGTSLSGAILHGDAHFRGDQVGVNSAFFDSSENRLDFKDNVKLRFGDSGDLSLSHNINDSVISHSAAATGALKILSGGAQSIECIKAGAVNIAHNGSTKIQTTSTGTVVTGVLTATSFSGPIVGHTNNTSGISTFYNLRVSNDLTVEGTTTTLDTNLVGVDRIEVGANSNTVVGVAITQSGTADIFNLYDGSTEVFSVLDGGNVGIGSVIPTDILDIQTGSSDEVTKFKVKTAGKLELTRNHAAAPFIKTFMSSGNPTINLGDSAGTKTVINGHGVSYFNGGELLLGHTSVIEPDSYASSLQVTGTNTAAGISILRYSNDSASPTLLFGKSRGTSIGAIDEVAEHDSLGKIEFYGTDTDWESSASIRASADGEWYSGSVGSEDNTDAPGRLEFHTTPNGADNLQERFRIESDGDFRLSSGDASTNYGWIRGWQSSTGDMIIGADQSATGTGDSKSNLIFRSRGSEKMRITQPGNVGINHQQPSAGLHIKKQGRNFSQNQFYDGYASDNGIQNSDDSGSIVGSQVGERTHSLILESTTTAAADRGSSIGFRAKSGDTLTDVTYAAIVGAKENSTTDDSNGYDDQSKGYLAFYTSAQYAYSPHYGTQNIERLRIDSSGNIGQSVTPSGWASAQAGDFYAYQVGSGIALFGRGSGDEDRGGIAANYYHTGSAQQYIGNGHAGRIYFEDGSIVFSNAAQNSSGAGAAMTLDERLRIHADGEVEIKPSVAGQTTLSVQALWANASRVHIATFGRNGNDVKSAITYNHGTNIIEFGTTTNHATSLVANNIERIRITSGGNVAIGGYGTPGSILDVREDKDGAETQIRLFNTDNGDTTTQTAAFYMSPDSRGTALTGIRAIKENADFSTNAGRDVSLTLNILQNNSQVEGLRITSARRVLIGAGAVAAATNLVAQGGLQVSANGASGAPTLCLGADGTSANTMSITDNTAKDARIGFPNYDIQEEPLTLMNGFVGDGSSIDGNSGARIYIGGGTSYLNAVNSIRFFTTTGNQNTVTGDERMRIDSTGTVRVGDNSSFSPHAAADHLVVGASSGSNGMTILTGNATGSIFFNDGSGNEGVMQYVHSGAEYMRIKSEGFLKFDIGGGTDTVRINDTGRLGVGSGQNIRAYLDAREAVDNTPLLNFGYNDGSFYRNLGTVGPTGDDGRAAGSYQYLHVRLRTVWNDTSMTMFRITGYTAYNDYTESYAGCYRYNHSGYRTNPYGQIVHNQKRATLHSIYNTGADPGYLVLVLDSGTNYIGYMIEHIGAGGAYASYMQQDLEIIDTKRDTTTNDQWPS